jgi:rubrerythrin
VSKAKPSKSVAVKSTEKKPLKKEAPAKKVEKPAPKKSAPVSKGKPSKATAPQGAAKKQPAKVVPIKKAEKPAPKKAAPVSKATPPKSAVVQNAVKKQAAKDLLVEKKEKPGGKKETPAVEAKSSKGKVPPAAGMKQPQDDLPKKSEKQDKRKSAPVEKEKPSTAKSLSFELDQLSDESDGYAEEMPSPGRPLSRSDLGKRFKCYKCGIKFYDLGKPQPLCPSCGANQLEGVIKVTRKRRGKQRSAFVAKTEPLNVTPDENEDLREVVDDLDAEFVLDMDDIVLEDHEDTEDKD